MTYFHSKIQVKQPILQEQDNIEFWDIICKAESHFWHYVEVRRG